MNESATGSESIPFPMTQDGGRTCPGQLEIPTPREQKALAAMRAIKEKVRGLKDRLSSLQNAGRGLDGEALGVKEELAHLKQNWERWEMERKAAARERMIILGHEKPD